MLLGTLCTVVKLIKYILSHPVSFTVIQRPHYCFLKMFAVTWDKTGDTIKHIFGIQTL